VARLQENARREALLQEARRLLKRYEANERRDKKHLSAAVVGGIRVGSWCSNCKCFGVRALG